MRTIVLASFVVCCIGRYDALVAAEPESTPQASTFVAKVGERKTVHGILFFLSEGSGCWTLLLDRGGRMQLANLLPEYQRHGLRVTAVVHMEANRAGDCVPLPMLFVDAIEVHGEEK